MSFGKLVTSLLNDSKNFIQYAKQAERNNELNIIGSFLRASILTSWSALEGWVNYICYSFTTTDRSLSDFEIAFLTEKKIVVNKNGLLEITNQDEYRPTLTKLLFILQRFGNSYDLKHDEDDLWRQLKELESFRHSIIHPKSREADIDMDIDYVEKCFDLITKVIHIVKEKIFDR